MNRKVYVANLSHEVGEPKLKSLFSKAGNVMIVRIVKDMQTGQSRGPFLKLSWQVSPHLNFAVKLQNAPVPRTSQEYVVS